MRDGQLPTATANASGSYSFTGLANGAYTVTAEQHRLHLHSAEFGGHD